MKKKVISAILCGAMVLGTVCPVLAADDKSEDTKTEAAGNSAKGKKIALVGKAAGNAFFEIAAKSFQETVEAEGGEVQVVYPETATADAQIKVLLPEEFVMIPMDATLIEQVLINLMENSIQHGGTTTRVEMQLRKEGENARFEVADNGQGIAREVFPKLFKGYLSHDEELTADGRRNMGIGLSVCMSIVRAHGGTMKAKNRATGGACVSFVLPMGEE